jgi:hypothetical protein
MMLLRAADVPVRELGRRQGWGFGKYRHRLPGLLIGTGWLEAGPRRPVEAFVFSSRLGWAWLRGVDGVGEIHAVGMEEMEESQDGNSLVPKVENPETLEQVLPSVLDVSYNCYRKAGTWPCSAASQGWGLMRSRTQRLLLKRDTSSPTSSLFLGKNCRGSGHGHAEPGPGTAMPATSLDGVLRGGMRLGQRPCVSDTWNQASSPIAHSLNAPS